MKIRRWAFPVIGALGLWLLVPLSARAANPSYGALAWSKDKHVAAAGFGSMKDGAIQAARDNCTKDSGASDCVTYVWFHNAVGAMAASDNNHVGTGYGWAWNADGSPDMPGAVQRAGDQALRTCTAVGGTNCRVVKSVDAGTVAHGEGGSVPLPKTSTEPTPAAPSNEKVAVIKKSATSVDTVISVTVEASLSPAGEGNRKKLNYLWFEGTVPGPRCAAFVTAKEISISSQDKTVWHIDTGPSLIFGPGLGGASKNDYIYLYGNPTVYVTGGKSTITANFGVGISNFEGTKCSDTQGDTIQNMELAIP